MGKKIKPVAFAKDLGVDLDPSLSYNDHVASTVSSCMAHLGQINRVKHAFDTNTLIIIINTLVLRSYITVVVIISLEQHSEHNLNRIQAVHNFVAHIISSTRKYDHISPILKDLQ